MRRILVTRDHREVALSDLSLPISLWPPETPLEIEIGFGKGRYLLSRAAEAPERAFLGIESAVKYYRLANQRALRRRSANVVTICGEALFLISCCLEPGRAEAVHVYFPDPWPKMRHQRRRLFEPENVDLVLSLLRPGGRLFFATDHTEYGALVARLLEGHPDIEVEARSGPWPDGPRTNYEAKYVREGRSIRRLVATLREDCERPSLHPEGAAGVVVGW